MNLFLDASLEIKQALLDAFGTAACLAEKDGDEIVLVAMNDLFRDYYGLPPELRRLPTDADSLSAATGLSAEAVEPVALRIKNNVERCIESKEIVFTETEMPQAGGSMKWSRNTVAPILRGDEVDSLVVSVVDITEMVQVQQDLEANLTRLIGQHVRICRECTHIENEQGQWQALETYMATHRGIDFSHGICPSCKARLLAC